MQKKKEKSFSCCWIVFWNFPFHEKKIFQLNYNLIFTIMFIYQEAAAAAVLTQSQEIWISFIPRGREQRIPK